MLVRRLNCLLIKSNCVPLSFSSKLIRMTSSLSSRNKKLIAVCQVNCKSNKDENYITCEKLIKEASSYGCSMAFLPECFDMINETRKDTLSNLEPIDGPLITSYCNLAKSCNIWLSLGGLHEKRESNGKSKKLFYFIFFFFANFYGMEGILF